ncbi:MAG TPA: M56 family metallopeptidase [Acetivibrio sp.]|nr:M56 family metallopeptidase [Acetivibrio sp.]
MSELFLSVLNMSFTASYVILIVILVRLLLKKAPKAISYALWAVVAFRLVIPFSFESKLSVMPPSIANTDVVSISKTSYQPATQIDSGLDKVDSIVNRSLPAPVVEKSMDLIEISIEIGAYIWILGIIALLVYSLVSVLILKKQLKNARLIENNIYEAKNLKTPFMLGVIRPKIYLPVGLDDTERSYILLHEQTHIRRTDHIIKIIAFLVLSVHWFNPLVWIAFMLMNTDMELSCDEKVLKEMNEDIKKPYANSLLSLAAGRHILNGSPLAFGEGNVKRRIKNVLSYKKFSSWVIAVSVVTLIVAGIALVSNPMRGDTIEPKDNIGESPSGKRVKIEFLSGLMGFKSLNKFETAESKIYEFIDSTIQNSLTPSKEYDFNNNYTNKYSVKLSGEAGEQSYELYYDTLYDKAYIDKGDGIYEVSDDFARYIDSFLEHTNITVNIDDTDAAALFRKYGWTLDYRIGTKKVKFNSLKILSGFNPNDYYFAYNNELSKDIGLDMSGYSDSSNIDVEIYRIYESMPQEFYPIRNCRGIVIKSSGKIIGAFISAGRHDTFNACSLKGNGFEKVTGKTFNAWLANMVKSDDLEARLSQLEPEQVIKEYFAALNKKDDKTAAYCISKKTLMRGLSSNLENSELFNESLELPLKGAGNNLKSAKLLKAELFHVPDNYTKIFNITVNLKFKKEITISNGEQQRDCTMVYESPQTGWKIESIGH